jgi:hypothetical protein
MNHHKLLTGAINIVKSVRVMKLSKNKKTKLFVKRGSFLFSAVTTVGVVSMTSSSVSAATLQNGWTYGIDSYNDATYRPSIGQRAVGGGPFEISGIALKVDENNISVALNSNLDVDGETVPYQTGYGHTGWGDLFLTNTETGKSYGMHFTTNNASGVSHLGIYENISTTSVGPTHDGWSSYSQYADFVNSRGGTPTIGNLAANNPLLNNPTNNILTSGNKIGDITAANLTGLDFEQFNANGSETFGFSFDRSLLEPGNYIAHIAPECANDWVGGEFTNSESEDVPEPSTMAALGLVGGIMAFARRRHQ